MLSTHTHTRVKLVWERISQIRSEYPVPCTVGFSTNRLTGDGYGAVTVMVFIYSAATWVHRLLFLVIVGFYHHASLHLSSELLSCSITLSIGRSNAVFEWRSRQLFTFFFSLPFAVYINIPSPKSWLARRCRKNMSNSKLLSLSLNIITSKCIFDEKSMVNWKGVSAETPSPRSFIFQ